MNRVTIIGTFGGIGVAVGFSILIASNNPSDAVKLLAGFFALFGLGMLVLSFKLAIDSDKLEHENTKKIIEHLKNIDENIKNLNQDSKHENNHKRT